MLSTSFNYFSSRCFILTHSLASSFELVKFDSKQFVSNNISLAMYNMMLKINVECGISTLFITIVRSHYIARHFPTHFIFLSLLLPFYRSFSFSSHLISCIVTSMKGDKLQHILYTIYFNLNEAMNCTFEHFPRNKRL